MARLGSILGGILAELARARVIADHLTKDLVAEYEADTVLASLSVPRVNLLQADLTLRFTVDDVKEIPEPKPDASKLAVEWQGLAASKVFPQAFTPFKFNSKERTSIFKIIAGGTGSIIRRPNANAMNQALKGNFAPAVKVTNQLALSNWAKIPLAFRKRMVSKARFQTQLNKAVGRELAQFINSKKTIAFVQAALGSTINVAIQREKLGGDPLKQQEIHLTLRTEDVDILLKAPKEE